jgi:hypothetical protein
MNSLTVSSNPALSDIVNAALKVETSLFACSSDVITALLNTKRLESRLLIIDLASIADAGRLIDFVKSSVPIRDALVIAIGAEHHFNALDQRTCEQLSGVVYAPFTAAELALIVAGLTSDDGSDRPDLIASPRA